jgi:hypothetical protein
MEAFGLNDRRRILGFSLALLGGIASAAAVAQQSQPISSGILEAVKPDSRVEVFYLGTPDCPYCLQWEAKARGELVAWAAEKGIYYVEIRGETLRQPIAERHYPAQHQKVFRQVGPSRGVPRFLLAVDGTVRLNTIGTNRYQEIFLPILKQVAERRANRS